MNQYIITGELRDLVMYRLGNEGYTHLKWKIKKETESRPYNPQAEREKALDEVISLINKNCFELEGKRLKITPLLLLQEIDKLRQEGKDGE